MGTTEFKEKTADVTYRLNYHLRNLVEEVQSLEHINGLPFIDPTELMVDMRARVARIEALLNLIPMIKDQLAA